MGEKGEKTKKRICMAAYKLFAEKGYKDVTMKDICEQTGLSRGGLYRHYTGTEQIFLEIVTALMDNQENEFKEKIGRHIPAAKILEDVLSRYEGEMIDSSHSLSLAIYEFFSNGSISASENSISRQYQKSRDMWVELIDYGIKTKEFQETDPEAVFDLIVFSYQGVRMYSKLMPIDEKIPKRIVDTVKHLLLIEQKGE
ncbi:MAG: TetR/AcrR family transcriptional regulator [Lachnospiraceae bacterium]|jgi:AcrR family transcriptional regulator|nr:TetR/AcrR family transcriptional regulator [Lachnospiraceae bacterium]